ncbi:MAG: hypothetical protein ACP5D9_19885, partial [Mariniphaga sp.]
YNSGNVGIGNSAGPNRKLLVDAADEIAVAAYTNNELGAIYAINDGSGPAADFQNHIRIFDGTQGEGKVLTSDSEGYTRWKLPASNSFCEQSNSDIFYDSGNIGIGANPDADAQLLVEAENKIAIGVIANTTSAAIDVRNYGSGPAAHFRDKVRIMDGTQGDGRVLTSDADGVASWQNPSEVSLWTQNGDEIYYSNNVGIGETTDPSANLDIQAANAGINVKATSFFITTGNANLTLDKTSSLKFANISFKSSGETQFNCGLLGNNNFRISTLSGELNGLEIENDGDVLLSDELHSSETGNANMMPYAFGTISDKGEKIGCTSNVGSVSHSDTGRYQVIVTDINADKNNCSIVLTINHSLATAFASVVTRSKDFFNVAIWDAKDNTYVDAGFSFVVYKP